LHSPHPLRCFRISSLGKCDILSALGSKLQGSRSASHRLTSGKERPASHLRNRSQRLKKSSMSANGRDGRSGLSRSLGHGFAPASVGFHALARTWRSGRYRIALSAVLAAAGIRFHALTWKRI
jgi:hypothetical protein